MGTASLDDIVSNQSAASSAAAGSGGTASLDDIVTNHGVAPSSTIGQKAADVGIGFVKGLGDTVSGVSHLLNKIPGVGETLAPSEGVAGLDQMTKSQNTAQDVGKGIESIAEFAAGDEALEGVAKASKFVALAQKYPLIAKTLQLATEHPWLAKILTEGTKGTVTGAAEGAIKGAQTGNVVRGAEKGAVLGGATGAALGTATGGVQAFKNARVNPFRAVTNAFTGADIQPTLKAGIQDVWNSVADNAGVPRPTAGSVQDLGQQVGDSILARSKTNYKLIDTATDGRFSGTEQALKAVNQDLRSVTNDTEEQNLLIRKTRLEMQLDQMFDDAEAKGVPKSTVDAAKNDFKQAQSIYDVNHQIRMSTTGVRPGMQGAKDAPEEVNAKSLMNRFNKLYNKGRLQQAVGDDGAEDLIGHTAIAQKSAKNVAKNQALGKTAARVVGYGAAAATGADVAHHFLD